MNLPSLTALDPKETGEGSLDPLGLGAIADSLGVMLVPGVRERQRTLRFLTATAVSLWVCETFEPERVGADGITPPWQVFEWYVVEGLVRSFRSDWQQITGTPGTAKVDAAIRDEVPVNSDRYLKTPRVFGFHGVYRILARDLGIEVDGRLGPVGYELVRTWAEEQGLGGFTGGTGPGAQACGLWRQAVDDGLASACVARRRGWGGWDLVGRHLAPRAIGEAEAAFLREALLDPVAGHRREVLAFLVGPGEPLVTTPNWEERAFHEALLPNASPGLKPLLETIHLYERFARLLVDAFDDCRVEMSRAGRGLRAPELAALPSVAAAAREVPAIFPDLVGALGGCGDLGGQFEHTLASFSERSAAPDWVRALIAHHRANQKRKQPRGKAPWIEETDDSRYLLRALYRIQEGGTHDGQYVHGYRTQPLALFAQDAGWFG